jgi:hypothetical protein
MRVETRQVGRKFLSPKGLGGGCAPVIERKARDVAVQKTSSQFHTQI